MNNYVPQSMYLQDMRYLRLKELTLGFTVPAKITGRVKIDRMRIYFTAYNLCEWVASFVPVYPESATNNSAGYNFYGNDVPFSRSYSFGLQITL